MKRALPAVAAGAALLGALTACGSTPDGDILEIEGAVNGAVIEFHSTSAGESVEVAVVHDHGCNLDANVYECIDRGEMLGEDPDSRLERYTGEGFGEVSDEPEGQ